MADAFGDERQKCHRVSSIHELRIWYALDIKELRAFLFLPIVIKTGKAKLTGMLRHVLVKFPELSDINFFMLAPNCFELSVIV